MDSSPPETHQVRRRSKRPRPPPDVHDDEYAAAMSLVLLLKSGGSSPSTDHPTISPPEAHQEVLPFKKQKLECESVFESSNRDEKGNAVILECYFCRETFDSGQALVDHVTKHWADQSTNIAARGSGCGNGDSGGAASSSGAKPVSDSNMKPIVSITMFHHF